MAEEIFDLYLYLARRDKTGVRILAVLRSKKQTALRIDDLKPLNLPPVWVKQIEKVIFDNRLLWEPFIETFETFDDLRNALRKRGYSNIPINSRPEFFSPYLATSTVNTSNLPQQKTMIAKKN
jgi:hypothetical protein